jgi:hypothetical protein
MNVQEWYNKIREEGQGQTVWWAAGRLAERDARIEIQHADLIASIQTNKGTIRELEQKLESSQRQIAETKQKLEEAEKRGAVAMSRLIENWLSKEYMPKILGFDLAKDEPWITRAYTTGWGGIGKTAQAGSAQIRPLTRIERRAEARRCRDAGIKPLPGTYGEDDLRELEIFEQVKRDTPECNQGEECSSCNTIAAKRFEEWRLARAPTQTTSDWGSGSCGESAAENEARETESLAHRIEKLENGRRYDNQCAVEKMLDAEKRLGMHDTQFRRTTERFDRHAKKLIDLDRLITNAMKGAAEKRAHANARIGTAEANIVDIRKTAEADRVEFRSADAAVHERIANLAERIGSLEAHRNGRTVG